MVTHQAYKFKKEFLKCLNISCHYKSAFRYSLIFFLSMKYLTPWSETFFHYRFFHMKTKQYTHTQKKYLLRFCEYSLEEATMCSRVCPSLSFWLILSFSSGFQVSNHPNRWFLAEMIKKKITT